MSSLSNLSEMGLYLTIAPSFVGLIDKEVGFQAGYEPPPFGVMPLNVRRILGWGGQISCEIWALFKLVVPSLLARSTCLSQLPLSHYLYRHSPSYLVKREKHAFTEDFHSIRYENGGRNFVPFAEALTGPVVLTLLPPRQRFFRIKEEVLSLID